MALSVFSDNKYKNVMIYTIAALYRFVSIPDKIALRLLLKDVFVQLKICGTLLIADEGINGTLASGNYEAIDCMIDILNQHTGLVRDDVKFSQSPDKPFQRLKIRLKQELITFKQPTADPEKLRGAYVEPKDWNALISDPEVIVLDTRNVYETTIGVFEQAQDPQIHNFTEFADFVRTKLNPETHKKIAMYCTGGIRCEKASAFMRAEGFEEVYHLKGGILKYLEEVPLIESKWNGECYVFDRRVAVGHGLTTGRFTMCFCCGYPLSAEDKLHKLFEDGVSCSYCHAWSTAKDKERFRARHIQMTSSSSQVQSNPAFQDQEAT